MMITLITMIMMMTMMHFDEIKENKAAAALDADEEKDEDFKMLTNIKQRNDIARSASRMLHWQAEKDMTTAYFCLLFTCNCCCCCCLYFSTTTAPKRIGKLFYNFSFYVLGYIISIRAYAKLLFDLLLSPEKVEGNTERQFLQNDFKAFSNGFDILLPKICLKFVITLGILVIASSLLLLHFSIIIFRAYLFEFLNSLQKKTWYTKLAYISFKTNDNLSLSYFNPTTLLLICHQQRQRQTQPSNKRSSKSQIENIMHAFNSL